jgi:hypothetical protein
MKKIILGILTLLVIGGTEFSCSKDVNPINNLSEMEKVYKANGNGWKIFAADCKGALSGAGTGAAVGTAVGGAGGATVGAIIGAVVGGSAASIEKAQDLKTKAATTVDGEVIVLTPVDESEMAEEASNPENPFDHIGFAHYKIVNYYLENNYLTADGVFDRSSYYDMAIDQLPTFMEENFAFAEYTQYYDFNALETTLSNIDLPFDTYLNPTLSSMLEEYNEYMESSVNFSDFRQYSVQKENEIISNDGFEEIEKQMVLSYMATARYGYWYWNKVIGLD